MIPTATHRQDVYIGEGLVDTDELDDFDEGDDHYNKSSRKVLDYLAIDVAERYLDDIYREDEAGDNTDSDGGSLSNDEAPNAGNQGLPAIWRPAIMKLNEEEVSSNQFDQKAPKETDRKKKTRTDKELAWQKVRQCLIEEEHQAALRHDHRSPYNRIKPVDESSPSSQDFRLPPEKLRVLSPPLWATAKVAPTVLSSFKTFSAAQDLGDTMEAFNKLMLDCGLSGVKMEEPWHMYCHIRTAVPAARKRVCIIGAGPVGLRAAVETVLLGGQVVVLEKRANFIRENMLHLWPWVVQDLASLGAKILFSHFCKSKMYFHVSTRQLQVILLKVALLVGVTVHTSTEFQSLVPPSLDGNGNAFYSVATQPQIPVTEFTAVLGASGTNDKLSKSAGINRFVFSRKEALGVVCYFPNLGTIEETKVKEFSWTANLKSYMLDKMRKVGLDLENIVYYRGEMHYLVMTPKRQNLLDRQVVKVNHHSPKDLIVNENVNQSALHEFAQCVVDFAGIPRRSEFTRVNLFDFSARTRADKAANVLTSHGKKLYVGLIGDLLLEPLWHEGVGTCRGFLGALDSVWMVTQIGKKSDEQLLADREVAYRVMQRLAGHRRDDMQKNVRKYTVDPRSRYTVTFPQLH
ncbi:hypothetical protein BBP00_00004189 [Phytophthora kernoviae]|uniref:[F-actin]-monooxygenase MICAL1-3-like Rossman domain-containing protein n=1 Tax=Phytophthora kernoviae TaxID=325452 RepID=A0A3F2RSI0_9STRA|nr:hypothetical protein BBP00_00004189 [Phytophthora kernoviae]